MTSAETSERRQAVMNKMFEHLAGMNQQCTSIVMGDCAYTDPVTKSHCLIGVLIPDEAYDGRIEGMGGIVSLVVGIEDPEERWLKEMFEKSPLIDTEDVPFLRDCQKAHDSVSGLTGPTFRAVVARHLCDVAYRYGVEDYNIPGSLVIEMAE